MPTPVSSLSPYCSNAQFLDRYDVRTIAELIQDTDESLDVAQVTASARLEKLLMEASGQLEAAALLGGKYTPADLNALTGNMGQWIAGIVADLAAPKVIGRRFMEFGEFQKRLEQAGKVLEALADGRLIFGLQENIDAGMIDDHVETASDVEARKMITYQASKYFGTRANRLGG